MTLRDQLLHAAKRAGEVLEDTAAKRRILEEGYTRIDPVAIAERDGIPVMVRPLEKLLGAFLRQEGSPGILVNSLRPIGMVHLTCAHELGHYFLGHGTKTDEDLNYGNSSSPDEQEANEFAYKLLMPRWLVAKAGSGAGCLGQVSPAALDQARLAFDHVDLPDSRRRRKLLPSSASRRAEPFAKILPHAGVPARGVA